MARESDSDQSQVLHVEENRVVVGEWSGDIMELAAKSGTLRSMLRSGRLEEARNLIRAQSEAEQAALVAMDENPDEVLALTAMDEEGKPGYSTDVVAVLPSEILTDLVAPRSSRFVRFNTDLIKAMPAQTFARTVADTLDPVLHQTRRTKISWEWLQAVAALQDQDKAAELLREVSDEALEEAIMDRLDQMGLGAVAAFTDVATVSRLQVFMEGLTGGRPGDYIDDPETAEVLDALYDAAPEILADMVKRAVRRSGGM